MSSISHIKAVIWSVETDNKRPQKPGINFLLISIKNYCCPENPAIHLPGVLLVSHFPITGGRSETRELRATNTSYALMSGLLLWSEITVTGQTN